MAMVGHRTESIYQRYKIADDAMLKESAAKLAALHESEKSAPDPMRDKRNSRNCSQSDALASFSNIFTTKVLPRTFILLRASAIGMRICSSPSACDLSFA